MAVMQIEARKIIGIVNRGIRQITLRAIVIQFAVMEFVSRGSKRVTMGTRLMGTDALIVKLMTAGIAVTSMA